MTVNSSLDVRSGLMDGGVDGESRGVDGVHISALNYLPFFVHKAQIFGLDIRERLCVRVDPEMVG